MTMYRDILQAAIEAADRPDTAGTVDLQELRDELARRRRALGARCAAVAPPSPVDVVARQVAYDASLVRLCRRQGIACDVADFATPGAARAGLESALAAVEDDPPPADPPRRGRRPAPQVPLVSRPRV